MADAAAADARYALQGLLYARVQEYHHMLQETVDRYLEREYGVNKLNARKTLFIIPISTSTTLLSFPAYLCIEVESALIALERSDCLAYELYGEPARVLEVRFHVLVVRPLESRTALHPAARRGVSLQSYRLLPHFMGCLIFCLEQHFYSFPLKKHNAVLNWTI